MLGRDRSAVSGGGAQCGDANPNYNDQRYRWQPDQLWLPPSEEEGYTYKSWIGPGNGHEDISSDSATAFKSHSAAHYRKDGEPRNQDQKPNNQHELDSWVKRRLARKQFVKHVRTFYCFFFGFFFPPGFVPGRGICLVGLTSSRPAKASDSFSGMRMGSPGFGIFDLLSLLPNQFCY